MRMPPLSDELRTAPCRWKAVCYEQYAAQASLSGHALMLHCSTQIRCGHTHVRGKKYRLGGIVNMANYLGADQQTNLLILVAGHC